MRGERADIFKPAERDVFELLRVCRLTEDATAILGFERPLANHSGRPFVVGRTRA
jgi:hypothetical protein